MSTRKHSKFKLPPIKQTVDDPATNTSVENFEKTLSVPKDNVRLTPEVDHLLEQSYKDNIHKKLVQLRKKASYITERLEYQWKTLEKKELAFQRTIQAHNRFVKRNLEKRERALLKIQNDIELTRKREKEIKLLDQRYDFFYSVLMQLRVQIKLHSIYEKYLNSVIEHSDCPFKTIHEFLTKYEALDAVKSVCMRRQSEEMATTIEIHDENIEFFRFQDVCIVGLRNELNDVRCKYDEVSRKNLATEVLIQDIVNRAHEYSVRVESCHFMIDAIYRYICQRRKVPIELLKSDIQAKIDCIKSTLGGWAKILTNTEPKTKKKKPKHKGKSFFTARNTTLPKESVVMWEKKTADPTKISDENDEETNQLS
ncbi:hypothetical protein HHI36_014102 [Cryptolaemus montrouzieri]|uniref:DUF4200 domain-containing protein n=1 Tax=Cryptolaemus montrouzieri TaxID=559131 RepID=A0ABD2N2H8_9CUCU